MFTSLERSLGADLASEVRLAFATVALGVEQLTQDERMRLDRLGSAERRAEWLRGRAALRRVQARRGRPFDSDGLRFPCACLSLAHSDDLAVAASAGASGVGVDFEHLKPLREQAARFFLLDEECAWIVSLPQARRSTHLLRLWTVKEALFKADLRNAGRTLRDYRIDEPWAESGLASTPDHARQRYTTRSTSGGGRDGLLTVAITQGEQHANG